MSWPHCAVVYTKEGRSEHLVLSRMSSDTRYATERVRSRCLVRYFAVVVVVFPVTALNRWLAVDLTEHATLDDSSLDYMQ